MIFKKMNRIFAMLGVMILLLTGCSASGGKESDRAFHVVTSFYPIYIMAWNLTDGVEGVELSNMAKPSTGCLHDYQLRPKDLVCLDGADIFLTNGAGMEDFLSDVLEAYPDLKICQAVDALEEGDAIEEEGEINPHTWLDPALYRKELAYFKDLLVEADPDHKEEYQANYERYDAAIEELLETYSWDSPDGEDGSSLGALILHESFPYILRSCHMELAGAADVEKDSGFSAREIRELVDLAKDSGAGYILSDAQYSGRISELLAEESGMQVWKLDSCVSGDYDKDAYLKGMRYNYETIMNDQERGKDR